MPEHALHGKPHSSPVGTRLACQLVESVELSRQWFGLSLNQGLKRQYQKESFGTSKNKRAPTCRGSLPLGFLGGGNFLLAPIDLSTGVVPCFGWVQ